MPRVKGGYKALRRFLLNELATPEFLDRPPVREEVKKGIVLFGSASREGLEPVRVVGRTVLDGPVLHGCGDDVGDLRI